MDALEPFAGLVAAVFNRRCEPGRDRGAALVTRERIALRIRAPDGRCSFGVPRANAGHRARR